MSFILAIFAEVKPKEAREMKRLMQLLVLLMAGTIAAAGAETLQWKYDSSSDTYYVTGIVYCDNPADRNYEQMGIYVPAAYMNATTNSDGTYTCSVKGNGSKNGYTLTVGTSSGSGTVNETTGIISVDCSGLKINGSDAIYTLDGRKADSNTKGIVIRGGKKFVVR